MRQKAVLVTGGAGFIGSHLVDLLVENYEVVVVDNFSTGKRENLSQQARSSQVFIHEADILDSDRMTPLLAGVETVFHLACLGVRHSIHSPLRNHEVNATGTLRLLQACRNSGVEKFIYVSSSEVYGTAQWVPMSEEHPTFPATVYGASKLAGECYARAFHRTYGYPTVVVRPFNAYGPRSHHEGDSGEVIPKFLLRSMAGLPMVIFGDGSQTRDFTYVTDTARGILAAAQSDASIGETINLGSGREIRIDRLAEDVAAALGLPCRTEHVEPRPGDVLRLFSDSTRARELLGFAPVVPLHEGLGRLKEWYQQQGRAPELLLQAERVRNWEAPESLWRNGG